MSNKVNEALAKKIADGMTIENDLATRDSSLFYSEAPKGITPESDKLHQSWREEYGAASLSAAGHMAKDHFGDKTEGRLTVSAGLGEGMEITHVVERDKEGAKARTNIHWDTAESPAIEAAREALIASFK